LRLYDVEPTTLNLFSLAADPQAIGHSLTPSQSGYGARMRQWWRGSAKVYVSVFGCG
jgi:hypothetical protein